MFDWQDVYSEIAFLVDKKRSEDAAKGNQIANILNGYIQRKVKNLAFLNKLKSGKQNFNTRKKPYHDAPEINHKLLCNETFGY